MGPLARREWQAPLAVLSVERACPQDLRHAQKRAAASPRRSPHRAPAHTRRPVRLPQVAPRRILCMWPEWFAPPQVDWPKQAIIAGFPFWPRPSPTTSGSKAGSSDVRPIVVTTGSTAAGQYKFYKAAVTACKALRRPAILVTPHKDHIPGTCRPISFTWNSRRSTSSWAAHSLFLHHGGIGSASYALAAGIPQIVMPMRGDQFDNANRLARLVAVVLPGREVRPERLAKLISTMLDSPSVGRAMPVLAGAYRP